MGEDPSGHLLIWVLFDFTQPNIHLLLCHPSCASLGLIGEFLMLHLEMLRFLAGVVWEF